MKPCVKQGKTTASGRFCMNNDASVFLAVLRPEHGACYSRRERAEGLCKLQDNNPDKRAPLSCIAAHHKHTFSCSLVVSPRSVRRMHDRHRIGWKVARRAREYTSVPLYIVQHRRPYYTSPQTHTPTDFILESPPSPPFSSLSLSSSHE